MQQSRPFLPRIVTGAKPAPYSTPARLLMAWGSIIQALRQHGTNTRSYGLSCQNARVTCRAVSDYAARLQTRICATWQNTEKIKPLAINEQKT